MSANARRRDALAVRGAALHTGPILSRQTDGALAIVGVADCRQPASADCAG
jgi:hypothetical protein